MPIVEDYYSFKKNIMANEKIKQKRLQKSVIHILKLLKIPMLSMREA